jgi:uncharacterized membrane protein (DUF485 family)
MNDTTYKRIEQNPKFKQLVAKRGRFAWLLASIMLGAYLAFILVIAFDPHLFAIPLRPGGVVTWGIPLGVGIIVLAFVLTGVYVQRANGQFDRMTQEILNEAKQ